MISVDDMCNAHYQADPSRCGIVIASGAWNTQIMHQPAWSLFDVIKLAGIDPVADGYRIDPHLPMKTFSLRLPVAGLAVKPGELRGYVRAERDGALTMRVRVPDGRSREQRARVRERRPRPARRRGRVRPLHPAGPRGPRRPTGR